MCTISGYCVILWKKIFAGNCESCWGESDKVEWLCKEEETWMKELLESLCKRDSKEWQKGTKRQRDIRMNSLIGENTKERMAKKNNKKPISI